MTRFKPDPANHARYNKAAGFLALPKTTIFIPIIKQPSVMLIVVRSTPPFLSIGLPRGLLVLALAVGSCGGSIAHTPSGVPASMRVCAQESDDARRLACYDREMVRAEKSYGLTEDQQRKLDPEKAPEIKPLALASLVVGVSLRSDGRTVITLENGQTWVQGEAYEPTAIHAGDAVSIKPGLLGALYMYLPSKQRTRVTRER